jgi:hypothetical protein
MSKNDKPKEMPSQIHKLCIRAEHEPRVATEGEDVTVNYFIKNIGNSVFPGGTLTIQILWPSMGKALFIEEPLEISKPIEPNSELRVEARKLTAYTAGYTVFFIVGAIAFDKAPVQVSMVGGNVCFPLSKTGSGYSFHVIRAQTHEEISQRNALWIAVGSLVVVAIFQVIDWIFRFFYKV